MKVFTRIRRPGRDSVYLSETRVEVNTAWNYACSPPYIFMAWYFTKHRYVITVPDGYTSVILAKFHSQSILNVFFLLTKLSSLKKAIF